jgi:membrane protein required for colicin V production
MQPYDMLMIGVLLVAAAIGAYKGFAWQVASIASLVVSYFAALRFRDAVTPWINQDPPWNGFVAMLLIYAVTSLAIWMLFRYVRSFIDRLALKEFDKQLGVIFGLAKGVLLCVVITFFAVTLWTGMRESILESRSGYYIAVLIDRADAVMPSEIHDVLHPYLHRLEKELESVGPKEHHDHPDDVRRADGRDAADTKGGTTKAGGAAASPPTSPPKSPSERPPVIERLRDRIEKRLGGEGSGGRG